MNYDKRLLQSNKRLIAVDLDGCLTDFSAQYEKFFGLNHTEKDFVRWDLINLVGIEFWSTMPWTPWGKELYNYCVESCPTIVLTSPSNHASSSMGKHMWLSRELKNRNWAISGPKWAFANQNTLLIDDSPKKINNFATAGGKTFLFTGIECLETCKSCVRNFVLNSCG